MVIKIRYRIMDKQRQQGLVKRYVYFFVFCVIILLIGIISSIPIKVNIDSVGEKPSFLFSLLFSASLLAISIGAVYLSYLSWFRGKKSRTNLTNTIEQLADRFTIFHLPIYKPTFLFWLIRFAAPVTAIIFFTLFLLVLFSAF